MSECINIQIVGLRRLEKKLERLGTAPHREFPPLLLKGGQLVANSIVRGVMEGRDVDGHKFKKLSPKTEKAKTRKGYRGIGVSSILQQSGRMIQGVMAHLERWDLAIVHESDILAQEYGLYHQRGTRRMPQRKWFGIRKYHNVEENIQRMFNDKIKEILNGG